MKTGIRGVNFMVSAFLISLFSMKECLMSKNFAVKACAWLNSFRPGGEMGKMNGGGG